MCAPQLTCKPLHRFSDHVREFVSYFGFWSEVTLFYNFGGRQTRLDGWTLVQLKVESTYILFWSEVPHEALLPETNWSRKFRLLFEEQTDRSTDKRLRDLFSNFSFNRRQPYWRLSKGSQRPIISWIGALLSASDHLELDDWCLIKRDVLELNININLNVIRSKLVRGSFEEFLGPLNSFAEAASKLSIPISLLKNLPL